MPTGLYIHVPFCTTKCNYCKFYSVKYNNCKQAKAYTAAVLRNVHKLVEAEQLCADTVFFGGGTPSLLYSSVAEILRSVPLAEAAEVTVECNPCDITEPMLAELTGAGVNRLSIGVQCLDDALLQQLGRRHNADRAVWAVLLAGEKLRNISVDIMIGIPGQAMQVRESLTRTVETIARLPVSHVSAYIYEGKTNHSDDFVAELYLDTVKLLGDCGFTQYEISNFARTAGGEPVQCRHNLKYWKREPYIGIGPAAHSFYGGVRFAVPDDLELFTGCLYQERELIDSDVNAWEERVMLGLRLSEGVALSDLPQGWREALDGVPSECYRVAGGRLSLTADGFLIANAIIGELLYCSNTTHAHKHDM